MFSQFSWLSKQVLCFIFFRLSCSRGRGEFYGCLDFSESYVSYLFLCFVSFYWFSSKITFPSGQPKYLLFYDTKSVIRFRFRISKVFIGLVVSLIRTLCVPGQRLLNVYRKWFLHQLNSDYFPKVSSKNEKPNDSCKL